MSGHRNQLVATAKILGTASVAALTSALLSSAALAQASATPAPAQSPPQGATPGTEPAAPAPAGTDGEGEVVVVGFRASLASALNAKRRDNGIVDVVKAEDIAKFPDTNLAESLQRVPGVAIDRDAGEGRSISVRGLGPDFTRVRINNIEALATTGGTDSSGGANRSRGFDFNVFASELFNSLTVRKSSSAEVQEGSLGATVDLQTARPFDFRKTTISLSAQARYNDLREKVDPRFAGLFSTTLFGGKLGLLASAAYSKRRLYEEGFSTVRYDNGPSSGGFCSPIGVTPLNPTTTATTCGPTAQGVNRLPASTTSAAEYAEASSALNFHPRLPRYGRLTHDQSRFGATGAIQIAPAEGTRISIDLVYSKLKATRQEDFLEAISFSRTAAQGGKPQTSVVDTGYDSDGDLLYGVYNGVDIRSESRFDRLSTRFWQRSIDIDQDITSRLKGKLRFGRATSNFRNPVQTTTTLDALNVNGYGIDFRNNDRLPGITYPFDVMTAGAPGGLTIVPVPVVAPPGTQPTTVTNTTTSEIRIRPQGANNRNASFQADLAWDAIPSEATFKAGFDWRKYEFDTFEFRRINQNDTIFAPPAGTTLASLTKVLTGFGKGLNLPSGTPTSWVIPDLNAIAAAYDIYCNCIKSGPAGGPGDFTLSSITNGNARGNNRAVAEKDVGGYVQMDASGEIAGFPVRGNIGIRYVETRQSATGYQATAGGTEVTVSQKYDDWLPSVNVAANITDDFIIRLAAAKVMARPQLGNLSPGGSIATTGNLTITVGNPFLKPFRANTVDASFEYYFHTGALIGLGLFYKNIGTYVQSLRTNVPYNQTGLPLSLLPANFTGAEIFQVTTPVNSPGGILKGFEINYQQPFYFLPGFLKNFGILANLTKVKSKIDYLVSPTTATVITEDLIGLSPTSANGTLYYDDGRFSIRGSVSYRKAFLQRVPGQNNNDVEGKNSTLNVDASMSYKITDRIEVTLEGVNLTDEVNDQFISRARNSPVVYNHTGREVYAGVRVKF